MKPLVVLSACLLALAGCRTPDYTKGQSNVCEVHRAPMGKRTVPIAYGMIPMSRAEAERGEWKRRREQYPNPGDCLPATSINARGEKRAVVFVCRQCEAAWKAEAGVSAEVVERTERKLEKLSVKAARETGTPRPSQEASFRVLADLAARGREVEPEDGAEALVFGVEERGGSRVKLFEVRSDARVAMVDAWIQDKAGSYTLRSATLFLLRGGTWMKAGQGQTAEVER